MAITPRLRVSRISRMLKSQLNKEFTSTTWLIRFQMWTNKLPWGTSVRCGKPLHLVSSMVMSQSDQKHALLKRLAQNIRWFHLKMAASRYQTMMFPWLSVFVKETTSKWNKSIRFLLVSAKKSVSNWWITSLTFNLQIRLMKLKKETSLAKWLLLLLKTGHNSCVVQQWHFLSPLSVLLSELLSVLWLVFTVQLLRLLINL